MSRLIALMALLLIAQAPAGLGAPLPLPCPPIVPAQGDTFSTCWSPLEAAGYCGSGPRSITARIFDPARLRYVRQTVQLVPATLCGFEDFFLQRLGFRRHFREIRHELMIRDGEPPAGSYQTTFTQIPVKSYYLVTHPFTCPLDSLPPDSLWFGGSWRVRHGSMIAWAYLDSTRLAAGDLDTTITFQTEPIVPTRDANTW